MTGRRAGKWEEYLAQALRFAELSRLATEYSQSERKKFPQQSPEQRNFETFEAIAIGVTHGFAIEMLLKGIREKNGLNFIAGHDLKKLMNSPDFSSVRKSVELEFKNYNGCDKESGFEKLLEDSSQLF